MTTWLTVNSDSDFSIHNIPFGIFKTEKLKPRVGTRIGDFVIDLATLNGLNYFISSGVTQQTLESNSLNSFIALGKNITVPFREKIQSIFSNENHPLKNNTDDLNKVLLNADEVEMLLPIQIGDYTDFYSSREHATNIGTMIRDPKNALMPNWLHLPVGYHGRASSITVSGTDFYRPKGQSKPADAESPIFGPSKLLDFELEMAFVVGKKTELGETVSTNQANDFIFGFALFNDWSARDIQTWEYVPLGPFLAKNFNSTLSPWIVTLEALEQFRVDSPKQEPEVLPYLKDNGKNSFDIQLEVYIQPENSEATKVCLSNFKYMYWTVNQQLAHHTINGCNINVGDLMASGTISGPTPDSYGSMMELSWRGSKPLKMNDGTERKFINDNDTVILKGYCEKNGIRVGFGEAKSKVYPSKN